MPGFNGTGPVGMGAGTGRGMGNCVSFGRTVRSGFGNGFGRGFGRGMNCNFGGGYRRGANYLPVYGEEDLNRYEQYLEDELNAVREQKKNNK